MKPRNLFILFIAFPGLLPAQTYQVPKSVTANGGGSASNSNYQINSTVGQPATGVSGNTTQQITSGFWAKTAALAQAPRITTAVFQNPATSRYIDVVVVSETSLQLLSVRISRNPDTTTTLIPMSAVTGAPNVYRGPYAFPSAGTYTLRTHAITPAGGDSLQARSFNAVLAKPGIPTDLVAVNGKAMLKISGNSVLEETYFLVDFDLVGKETVYRFGPDKEFPGALSLELTYEPTEFPDAGKLFIYHKEGKDWKPLRSQVYPGENKVKAYTTRLGEFKLVHDAAFNGTNIVPSVFVLRQNYPNPFNPSTTISYDTPEDGYVVITIYNLLGQQVKTLSKGTQLAGRYTLNWDATNETGQPVASGVYFYRIQTNKFVQTKKMLLLR